MRIGACKCEWTDEHTPTHGQTDRPTGGHADTQTVPEVVAGL